MYHTAELLSALAGRRSDLLAHMTVCAVDRAGPDTDARIAEWVDRYPSLQVVARTAARERVRPLDAADETDAASFARLLGRLLRPGGILVQDVQLSTLPFLPADRWWESIYVAATVRGLFAERAPTLRFLSNKRGYAATFGRDLLEAGVDPRDVMDKSDLERTVVPAIASLFDRNFPLELEARLGGHLARRWPVGGRDADRREIDDALDIVLWASGQGMDLEGRRVAGETRRVALREGGHEASTWRQLIEDRLADGPGLPVIAVGERVGPPAAERAELSNLAARHIHTLRSRLDDPAAIVTRNHRYSLAEGLHVGICGPSATFGGARTIPKVVE